MVNICEPSCPEQKGMDQKVFPTVAMTLKSFWSQVWSCLCCVRFSQRSEIPIGCDILWYVMLCMTVMICYDHCNFNTFWVTMSFSQTFQQHFKSTWINLDVSFPAKEWTRWTDAVGKLWLGSKSALVQSVFLLLSKWKHVAHICKYTYNILNISNSST